MKCPHCAVESNGLILETRKHEDVILRRRYCGGCGNYFCSSEYTDTTIRMVYRKRDPKPKVGRMGDVSLEAFKAWR
jgi:transcriptional regulator NrdR family protein